MPDRTFEANKKVARDYIQQVFNGHRPDLGRGFGHSRKLSRSAGPAPPRPRNFDTGVPWVDAEDDFARAHRRHVLSRLVSWLRREPDDTSLLRFDEVLSVLGFRGEYYLGLRTIRLDTVVGTVEEARGFDRRFRPVSDRDRERWELLDLAERYGTVIPPIEVYRIGDLHFVKDGHHRVSVAIATGQQMIDADVTEVLTQLPATGISRHSDLMRIANSGESASSPCSGPGQSPRVRAVPAPPTLP